MKTTTLLVFGEIAGYSLVLAFLVEGVACSGHNPLCRPVTPLAIGVSGYSNQSIISTKRISGTKLPSELMVRGDGAFPSFDDRCYGARHQLLTDKRGRFTRYIPEVEACGAKFQQRCGPVGPRMRILRAVDMRYRLGVSGAPHVVRLKRRIEHVV